MVELVLLMHALSPQAMQATAAALLGTPVLGAVCCMLALAAEVLTKGNSGHHNVQPTLTPV